jgi:hypothetical protein
MVAVGRRLLAGVAGLAASVSVVTLVIAETNSNGKGHPRAAPLLFAVFLVSLFALLAVTLIDADRRVDLLSEEHQKSPRWSMRETRKRLVGRVGRAARTGLTQAARQARGGGAWLRGQLEAERRQATMAQAKERWNAALVVMGMPPDQPDAGRPAPEPPANAPAPAPMSGVTTGRALTGVDAPRSAIGTLPPRGRRPTVQSRPPRWARPPVRRGGPDSGGRRSPGRDRGLSQP